MKKIFKIDTALYPLGLLTALTGFGFHIAGHGNSHHVWELWAYAHTLIAIVFVVLLCQHLLTHKAWVRGLKEKALRKKRRVTMALAIVAIAVIVTGISLLFIWGANTHTGLLHYKLGIAFTLLTALHSVHRFSILRKAFHRA